MNPDTPSLTPKELNDMLLTVDTDGLCVFCGEAIEDDASAHQPDCVLVRLVRAQRLRTSIPPA